jgi:hypothetical protein
LLPFYKLAHSKIIKLKSMKQNNRKHLVLTVFTLTICAAIFALLNFSFKSAPPERGNIEGYVFPAAANARVVVAIPKLNDPEDTIHRVANPNAQGYFKINNLPVGEHRVVFYPRNPARYKTTARGVIVTANQTTSVGNVTLAAQ